jgi:hypothetical protein
LERLPFTSTLHPLRIFMSTTTQPTELRLLGTGIVRSRHGMWSTRTQHHTTILLPRYRHWDRGNLHLSLTTLDTSIFRYWEVNYTMEVPRNRCRPNLCTICYTEYKSQQFS